MNKKNYMASAPGSLMLFGEHAVLHDKQAIVCSINKRIKVSLSLREDRQICIKSGQLGSFNSSLDNLIVEWPFHFILEAIKYFTSELTEINFGLDLCVESEFAETLGLGSSAAVTVATLKTLYDCFLPEMKDLKNLFFAARNVIRKVQGIGSGADIAASIFGGIIAYKMSPFLIDKISNHLPLVVIYSGSKTPTVDAIHHVNKLHKKYPHIFSTIYDAMDKCAIDAAIAIKNNELSRVGELMNIHQGLQDSLGVNNYVLSDLIYAMREHKHILGAKISGAGLGDCVIGLGEIMLDHFPRDSHEVKKGIRQIDVSIENLGLRTYT